MRRRVFPSGFSHRVEDFGPTHQFSRIHAYMRTRIHQIPSTSTPLPTPRCGTHIHNPKSTDLLFPEPTRSLTDTIKTPVPLLWLVETYRHTLFITNMQIGPPATSRTTMHKCDTVASICPDRSGIYTSRTETLRLSGPKPLPPPTYSVSNHGRPLTPYTHISDTNTTSSIPFPSPRCGIHLHDPKSADLLYPEPTRPLIDNRKP
jgi:hypothetical protein